MSSSSWLPLYSIDNAILYEEIYTGEAVEWRQNAQTSWCANFNEAGEWIQITLQNSQYIEALKIAGNPLLNAFVTDIDVYLSRNEASKE